MGSRATGSARARYEAEVAAYVAAGGSESVQRVVTAVQRLHRRLAQWYDQQLIDLNLNSGEWGVLSHLATVPDGKPATPSQLAAALSVAPSSMTHRLDRMTERGLVSRVPDEENRTRVLVSLTDEGWRLFQTVVRESDVVESSALDPLTPAQREELAALLELAIDGPEDPAAG